ncbi:hypothetical protein ACFL0V_03085 [Nanoarchaeota archaeon]
MVSQVMLIGGGIGIAVVVVGAYVLMRPAKKEIPLQLAKIASDMKELDALNVKDPSVVVDKEEYVAEELEQLGKVMARREQDILKKRIRLAKHSIEIMTHSANVKDIHHGHYSGVRGALKELESITKSDRLTEQFPEYEVELRTLHVTIKGLGASVEHAKMRGHNNPKITKLVELVNRQATAITKAYMLFLQNHFEPALNETKRFYADCVEEGVLLKEIAQEERGEIRQEKRAIKLQEAHARA